jgi:hypothetical protein
MKAATPGHVPREQRVGQASMKGRPVKSGDQPGACGKSSRHWGLDEGPPDQERRRRFGVTRRSAQSSLDEGPPDQERRLDVSIVSMSSSVSPR